MALAGELEIRMFAELARLRDDMNKATGIVNRSTKGIESAAAAATKALGLLGIGISAVGFVNLIKGSIDAMDKLNDLRKSTDLTVEQLAGLKVLAKQSGTDLDGMAKAINKMSVEMGKSPESFRALGITATDNIERFKQLADLFNSLPDINQRNALANKIFGKSWAEMAPALSEGSKKIGELIERGTRFSGVTEENVRQADAFNDKLALLVGSGGALTRIIGPLLPLLNTMADDMVEAADKSARLSQSFSGLLEITKVLVVMGSNVSFIFQTIGKDIARAIENVQLIAKGDFAGSKALGEAFRKDAESARLALDAYQKTIMAAGTGPLGIAAAKSPVIPGAGAKVAGFLGTGEAAAKAAEALHKQRLKSLEDISAESYKQWQGKMKEHLQVVADLRKADFDNAVSMGGEMRALFEANIEKDQVAEETGLETLRTNLLTEDELRKFAYEADFNLLNDTLGMKKEAQEEYYTLMGRLIRKNALEHLLIERQKNEAVRAQQVATWQAGAELLQQFAGESQAAAIAVIAINKALAIAQVMQNIPVAQARALAELGPIAGAAAAASIGAWGAVQIGLIAATGLMQAANVGGSGADLGSVANPISTTSDSGAAATSSTGSGTTTIINIQGDNFSRKGLVDLIEQINEATRDGGRIIVT